MDRLSQNLANRRWLLDRLRAEIIGPDPTMAHDPLVLEPGGDVRFDSWGEWRRPKIQANGEEILWQDPPIKRYGAGVLFPIGITDQRQISEDADTTPVDMDDGGAELDVRADEILEKQLHKKTGTFTPVDDDENHEVTLANAYRPSAIGISFLAALDAEDSGMRVAIQFARYARQRAFISRTSDGSEDPAERELWFRVPGSQDGKDPVVIISRSDLLTQTLITRKIPGQEDLGLRVVVVSRPVLADDTRRLVTVCLVNHEEKDSGRLDESCYFQCAMTASGASGNRWILPYPEPDITTNDPLSEERISRLLYRDRQTHAVGHGCAADWAPDRTDGDQSGRVAEVRTECLPEFETPTTSAEISGPDGANLRVSMRKLAGLVAGEDGLVELEHLISSYSDWIEGLHDLGTPREVDPGVRRPPIPDGLKPTARELLSRCARCLDRMRDGLEFLRHDSAEACLAGVAFRMMNEAMLIGQLRSSRDVRTPSFDHTTGRIVWDRELEDPDPDRPHPEKGYWRPFQIAFILMTLRGICDPLTPDRDEVDLIWFPTGGGKTEAYLGLTAFTLIFNRLSGRGPGGADVIMRYTLRLLTAQQFQRAGLLFCALEHVRLKYLDVHPDLGESSFRIGMWVGGRATPNSRAEATRALRILQKEPVVGENPFVLLKCPWCNGRFGPITSKGGTAHRRRRGRRAADRGQKTVYGYREVFVPDRRAKTVVFQCDDPGCEYGRKPLPIVIIDEDLYEDPPSLVIATVDKFAMLAWKPEVRTLFGIDNDGDRAGRPPSLIIQDELHLISGPLGSMVGAYETVIDQLCTTHLEDGSILRPKIVASTATISRAEDQVRALYARPQVNLFPPAGLEAGDSFFARQARQDDGTLAPGRLYAGVMAPAHGSQQTTQARVFAALLQYPAIMQSSSDEASTRDPWWTLVAFFNSLRELGGAATLLVADTRDYLRVIIDRHGLSYGQIRQLLNVEELTSRIRSDQIPLAIQKLEAPFLRDKNGYVQDTVEACLASSIIEVGVDIDRLSLMTIVGQPKTTSQYIQVSSRVGRRLDAPGLVVITYSQSKPRDRSHYERFRSYHDRLYAQVEPTSVTPFSPPAVDRALHGVLVGAVRQRSGQQTATAPRPCPVAPGTSIRQSIEKMFEDRVLFIDPEERDIVMDLLSRRFREWHTWDPREYGGFGPPPADPPLMHPAGSTELESWNGHSWPTLTSLRDVDASCEAEVTRFYVTRETGESEL